MLRRSAKTVHRLLWEVTGSREKNTKNPRMRRVEDCTGQAARILERQGVETRFEINPGNHFADGAARLRKGLAFLLGPAEHKTTVASSDA